MFEKLDKCPICKHGHFENFLICKDHSLSGESFAIVECKNCNFKFTNPRPDAKSIISYYESDSYVSLSDKDNNLVNFLYRQVRKYTLKKKLHLINSLSKSKKKNLLDMGCGAGHFLQTCKEGGWNAVGVESNPMGKQKTEKKIGVENVYAEIKQLPADQKFNIISFWHVLEHIHDLEKSLKSLKKRLTKKGRLVIALPNNASFDAQFYKNFWAGYDVPRHLYHFRKKDIKLLAKNLGFKLIKSYPMKLDAYYVSLLSEKYKSGRNSTTGKDFFRALIIGRKSNKWAKSNKDEYSSLIHVLKIK